MLPLMRRRKKTSAAKTVQISQPEPVPENTVYGSHNIAMTRKKENAVKVKAMKRVSTSRSELQPEKTEAKRLRDFCSGYRGLSSDPKAANKKRLNKHSVDARIAKKQAIRAQARPGVEFVNGQMVIKALEVGAVNSDEEDDREEVDEEAGLTSTYWSFTNRVRTERWGIEETRRFYKALQQCGTDFTMMNTLFPGRTQKQLLSKFRKENKERYELVSKALNPKTALPLDVDTHELLLGVDMQESSRYLSAPDPSRSCSQKEDEPLKPTQEEVRHSDKEEFVEVDEEYSAAEQQVENAQECNKAGEKGMIESTNGSKRTAEISSMRANLVGEVFDCSLDDERDLVCV